MKSPHRKPHNEALSPEAVKPGSTIVVVTFDEHDNIVTPTPSQLDAEAIIVKSIDMESRTLTGRKDLFADSDTTFTFDELGFPSVTKKGHTVWQMHCVMYPAIARNRLRFQHGQPSVGTQSADRLGDSWQAKEHWKHKSAS